MKWAVLASFFTIFQPAADAPPPMTPPAAIVQAIVKPSAPARDCVRPCVMSADGLQFVMTWEGYMPFPYDDVVGIKTVGFGHVIRPHDRFTYPLIPEVAQQLLRDDMKAFERGVNGSVTVSLFQQCFDALTSFSFNLGTGALKGSTLLKRINAERYDDVPACFLMWNKAQVGGKLQPVPGLTKRRAGEGKMCVR